MLKKILATLLAVFQLSALNLTVFAEEYMTHEISIGGWNLYANPTYKQTYELTENNAYEGKSLHITKASGYGPGRYTYLTTNLQLKANTQYRYGMMMKAVDAYNIKTHVAWKNMEDVLVLGKSFEWTEMSYDYFSTSSGVFNWQINFDNTIKGIWFDNMYFCEVLPDGRLGENLVLTSTFDDLEVKQDVKSEYQADQKRFEVMNNGKGTVEDLFELQSAESGILVKEKTAPITLDGDLADWENTDYSILTLPGSASQVTTIKEYSGAEDCSAEVRMCYDDNDYYIAVSVTDDKFVTDGQNYQNSDSLQINFGESEENQYMGLALIYGDDGGYYTHTRGDGGDIAKTKYVMTKGDKGNVIYELSIPREVVAGIVSAKLVDRGLTFNVLINDNDGDGRSAYVQWKPGMGEGTGATAYGQLVHVPTDGGVIGWIKNDRLPLTVGKEYAYPLWLANVGEAKTITLTDSHGAREIEMAENEAIYETVFIESKTFGKVWAGADITYEGGAIEIKDYFNYEPTAEYYEGAYKSLKDYYMPQINKLWKECEEAGLNLEYHESDMFVLERFFGYGVEDARNDYLDRAGYVYICLQDICTSLIETLNAYLKGEAFPPKPVKYQTSDIGKDGIIFTAEDTTGERRPMYFHGYGHFQQAVDDIPYFNKIGVNFIQIEIGPNTTLLGEDENGYIINYDYLENTLKPIFKTAEEHNISIALLVSPHYVPGWFAQKYPEACDNGYCDLTNNKYREMQGAHVRAVMEAIGNSPALHDICLSNESGHGITQEADEQKYYQEWLREYYNNDIRALNDNYGTQYTDFSEFEVFDAETREKIKWEPDKYRDMLPMFADLNEANNELFTDYHKYINDIIQEVCPGTYAGVKVMQNVDGDEREWRRMSFLANGVDYEMLGNALDINGNDANSYYGDDLWGLSNKFMTYDLQTSVADKPVCDYENHVIWDRETSYPLTGYYTDYVAAMTWQGAVHGLAGSAIWIWERTYDAKSDFAGSILHRPDVLLNTSHAMLDINRFSYELEALSKGERTIGVLYSQVARIYSLKNSDSLVESYDAATYYGDRVRFVSENQVKSGEIFNSDMKVMIVPFGTHYKEGTLEGIKKYIEQGGKVLIIGDETLAFDEHDKPVDAETRKYVFDNSYFMDTVNVTAGSRVNDSFAYPTKKDIHGKLLQIKKTYKDNTPVTITDARTGAELFGVNYHAVEYEGSLLINICDYEYRGDKRVDVRYNGVKIAEATELRSNKKVVPQSLALEPFNPILLSIPLDALPSEVSEFSDTEMHWSKYAVKDLSEEKIVFGVSETEYAPDEQITVRDFEALLARAIGKEDNAFEGVLDTDASAPITREQMAYLLVTEYKAQKEFIPGGSVSGYADLKVSQYPTELSEAVRLGYLTGYDEKTLAPTNTSTRAEAAAVIMRFMFSIENDLAQIQANLERTSTRGEVILLDSYLDATN